MDILFFEAYEYRTNDHTELQSLWFFDISGRCQAFRCVPLGIFLLAVLSCHTVACSMDQAVDAKHCLVQSIETDKVCTGAETEQTDQKKI